MSLADFPDLLDRLEQGTLTAEDAPTLRRLAAAAPGHVTAHVALACACERAGRPEEARQSWVDAALLLPDSPAVRAGLRRTAPAEDSAPPEGEETPIERLLNESGRGDLFRDVQNDDAQNDDAQSEPPDEQAPAAAGTEAPPAFGSAALRDLAARSPAGGAPGAETETNSHDDLDGLIEQLEGARIEPTPDPADVPVPNLDTGDGDMVSPTLARIYEAQSQYAEAARVYRRLAEQNPGEADEYRRQAEAMQTHADEQQ